MPIRAVLFDLDGTLLDTARDMVPSVMAVMEECGVKPLPYDHFRPYVSRGGAGLVDAAFGKDQGTDLRAERIARFLQLYRERLARETRAFDGVNELLDTLEARGTTWGIVTNKPTWLTSPLLEEMRLSSRAAVVVCGDTLPERKPSPMPLLHAAAQIEVPPSECVYLGDDLRDAQAARAAGMIPVVATYGYIPPTEKPDEWDAEGWIDAPAELPSWLALSAAVRAGDE